MVLSKAITKAVTNPEGCSPLERNEEQENVLGKLNGITEGRAFLWPGNGVDINRAWFMPLVTAGWTMVLLRRGHHGNHGNISVMLMTRRTHTQGTRYEYDMPICSVCESQGDFMRLMIHCAWL